MSTMRTRSMSMEKAKVFSSPYFHKGFDNENDPKTIAGFSIPTTEAGWTDRLDEIELFVKICKDRIMNHEKITDQTKIQRYINFLNVSSYTAVASRYGLFTKNNIVINAYRTYTLRMALKHLNQLA